MQTVLIPTGYMGSGSSAITDILGEFDCIDGSRKDFEYVFMHCPNGLFDLEDKLLVGNNAIRSDEALRTFREAMQDLYDKPLWWPGNYKKNFRPDFMEITDNFISQLTQFHSDNYWYYQEKSGLAAFPQLALNKLARIISGGKIHPLKPLRYKGMIISLASPEEFYLAAQEYLNDLFSSLSDSPMVVLDQLLLPFNLWRMDHYFSNNAECFVVERDPRDVFAINKYVWEPIYGNQIPYPTEVKAFCNYYRKLRQSERSTSNPHVHCFHFENLVYHYDECIAKIMAALSLDASHHIHKRELFDPEISMGNTQIFNSISNQNEIEYIKETLSEYLYEFPYENTPKLDIAF